MKTLNLSKKNIPSNLPVESVNYTARAIERARDLCDAYGGSDKILDEIASGGRESHIARKIGITILQLSGYLRAVCDAPDIESARNSQIQCQFEQVEDGAATIEDDKKRFDAMMEAVKWRGDKESIKYRNKVVESAGAGISISIDWGNFKNG